MKDGSTIDSKRKWRRKTALGRGDRFCACIGVDTLNVPSSGDV